MQKQQVANPEVGVCPGAAVLEAFAGSGSDDAVLLAHLEACAHCRGVIAEIKTNNEFLHDYSRELRPPPDMFEDPGIPPDLMPGYKLMGEIHRGAQGIVYRAEQESTKRTVAIKMLLQGAFATPRQRARFEREAEIAAQLRHSCIVTVYDSMTVRGGRFALVMEYIDGATLDSWNERPRIETAPGRIRRITELFADVCDAVHYAHQRGVIHRDLKPANILVDDDGRPHVLDFGIAKVSGPSGDGPLAVPATNVNVTQPGEFAGTLAYASPEQLSGQPDRIDLRTDVYSLGVVLFELLTGEMPYEVRGSFAEVIDNILNREPPDPGAVNPAVDDDLATITLRALEKNQDRRYQSAGALLADLRHYLGGEAIDAKKDSSFYVLRKAIGKRKAIAVAVVSVVLAILVGLGMGGYALAQRSYALTQSSLRTQVDHERKTAEATKSFLSEMLTSLSPSVSRGREVKMTYVLKRAEDDLAAGKLAGQPDVEAQVRMTLGNTYNELSMYDLAIKHLERAAELLGEGGARSLPLAAAQESWGRALGLSQMQDRAEGVLRRSLAIRRELAGAGSLEVASTLNTIGSIRVHNADFDSAESPLREALAIRMEKMDKDDPQVIETKTCLALSIWEGSRHDYPKAEKLLRECLAQRRASKEPDHPYVADSLYQLSHLLNKRGKVAEARALAEDCLNMRIRLLGADNVQVADAQDLLGGIYATNDGSLRDAEPLLVSAIETYRRVYGADTLQTTRALQNLGRVYYKLGNYEKAEPALKAWHANLKADKNAPPEMIDLAQACLVQLYEDWEKPEEAAKWESAGLK